MSAHPGDDDGTVIRPGTSPQPSTAATSPGAPTGGADVSRASQDSHALPLGTRLSEFELTSRIGEGGFSIVYLAWDHSLERSVALKEYMPASIAARFGQPLVGPRSERHRETYDAGLKSFVNEAKLLARFDHPALVKVYRFWEANGTAYMIMPFYEGMTLRDTVRALPRPPDEAWLLDLLAPLTEALAVIHAERCYHRDIAPDNVILLAGSAKPLLLDFGAARRVIGDMTHALTVILKPGYAPVEQYAEVPGMQQGPWTDVYALAAVVCWAITGKTPPPSVGRMLGDDYVPLAERVAGRYSQPFLQAIDRALAVLPERRTQSIDAFRSDIGLGRDGGAFAADAPSRPADPQATLVRPERRMAPGAATAAPQRSADEARPAAAAAAMPALPAAAGDQPRRPRAADSTPEALPRGPADARAPDSAAPAQPTRSRLWLGAAAVAAMVVAASLWWKQYSPAVKPSVPLSAPAATTNGPAAASSVQPGMPPDLGAAAAKGSDASGTPPVPPAQPASVPAAPPPRAAPPSVRPDDRPAPAAGSAVAKAPPSSADRKPAQAPKASSKVPKPEPHAAAAGNSAECARTLQRLSLGENSNELMARVKALDCR